MYAKILNIVVIILLLFAMVGLPIVAAIAEIRKTIKERKKGDLR